MFPGTVEYGRFSRLRWRNAVFAGNAKDGYVTGRVEAGSVIAITAVVKSTLNGWWNEGAFVPCRDSETMVFRVPNGKVVYLGSVAYSLEKGRLGIKYSNALPAAQEYVNSNFPALSGKVESISPVFMPTTERCQSTLVIPTYS
jgi:hypothetical protein